MVRVTEMDPASPFNGKKGIRITSSRQAAAFLRHVRTVLGWSQRKLAAASGIRQSSIGGYEAGELNPSMPTLLEIGGAMGYDLWWVPKNHVVMILRPEELLKEKEANNDAS